MARRSTLKSRSRRRRAIIFSHFPVYPASTHNLWDARGVVEILSRHPSAIAHLNGHRHQGDSATCAEVHYLTLRALLETPSTPTCAIAHLSPSHLNIRGYGNQPSLLLPLKEPIPDEAAESPRNPDISPVPQNP